MKDYQLTPADIEELQKWGYDSDEINSADRRIYTYGDWLNPEKSMGPFNLGGWGIKTHYLDESGNSTTKENGKLTLFILPEDQGKRIHERKEHIVNTFVEAYFTALVNWFDTQYEGSLEKKILVEKELEEIKKLLFNQDEDRTYRSFGDGLWLSFYNYARNRQGSISYWYDRFCVKGNEKPESAVSRYHSTIKAKDLANNPTDSLHFVVSALALNQYKTYLTSKLELLNPIALTFEDWYTGSENWKYIDKEPDKYPIYQPFEFYAASNKDGKYQSYSLSVKEYGRISASRNAIFEKQSQLFLKGEIEDFERRFSASLDKTRLLQSEINKIDLRLTDESLTDGYTLHNPDGEDVIFSNLIGRILQDGKPLNEFPHWYNKLIVQGEDARKYVEPEHEDSRKVNHAIAVHVLYRYKHFLENRAADSSVKSASTGENIPSKTLALFCFYRESQGEYPELEGLNRKQIAEKIAYENNLSPNHFRQDLSAMQDKSKRLVRENIPRIQQAIGMLTDYKKSLKYAQDELQILQVRKG